MSPGSPVFAPIAPLPVTHWCRRVDDEGSEC